MGIEELDESGDEFDLFERFDDERSDEGMAGVSCTANAGIKVMKCGQIESGEDKVVFIKEVGVGDQGVKIVQEGGLFEIHFVSDLLF
jgi:hypothetical protein